MIDGYQQGSDITLMNTMYIYPKKDENSGKYKDDLLYLIYKDNQTGEKKLQTVTQPDYEFYMSKPEYNVDYNEMFREESQLDKITCPYTALDKTVAEKTGNLEAFYENIKVGNRRANKQFHTLPNIFSSDTHIEDHYRFRFSKTYTNNINPITKAYFDIEADTINMKGDFPEMGECPINAVSYICPITNTVYCLLLRNPENPLIEEFEKSINSKLFDELKNLIINHVGGWKQATRFKVIDLKYEFLFFDQEIDLIKTLFNYINKTKPDFLLAWNMSFDVPYIIERIKVLGYSPEDIMCHKDFSTKIARYIVDENNKDMFAERGDFAYISSYTTYLDQMIHFASRRKGQSAFTRFKLDYIGQKVCKVAKLSFSHITTSIAKFPWLAYKLFAFYNIIDTVVQKCIESKVGDIDYLFSKCTINNTRYNKGHRQTVYLVNRGTSEFYMDNEEHFVMGNNCNRTNVKPADKFPGALVGNPTRNSTYSKIKIGNVILNVVDNLNDFDFKSEYPSAMREFNIAPNTQIGMVKLPHQVHAKENRFNYDKYSRGGQFLEDFHSHVWIEFCQRWLHFAGYEELMDDITDYFTNVKAPIKVLRRVNSEGQIVPLYFAPNNTQLRQAISFADDDSTKAIEFYIPRPR